MAIKLVGLENSLEGFSLKSVEEDGLNFDQQQLNFNFSTPWSAQKPFAHA
jgi:hypothetical protein